MLANHPHVFALEIVHPVAHDDLDAFIDTQRARGRDDFDVRSFGYDSDRQFQSISTKYIYYPVIFMEPLRPGSEAVLGLDIDTVPFLRQAMSESIETLSPVATRPFQLAEGNLAFVLFLPAAPQTSNDVAETAHEPTLAHTVALVAGRLLATVRSEDTVCRISGDEFVVIAENLEMVSN